MMKYYNLAFALPSIIYGVLVFRIWSSGSHSLATQQVNVLQAYAYLYENKDRLTGKTHEWVASGKKGHKNTTYSQARSTAIAWTALYQTAFFVALAIRLEESLQGLPGTISWWDPLPQIILYLFNLYLTLPFLLTKLRK